MPDKRSRIFSRGFKLDAVSRMEAGENVSALTEGRGIDAARLTPAGVGFLAPVASNRGDAGRAQNRRMKLVER